MTAAAYRTQKARILSYPLAEGCHLKPARVRIGEYLLIQTETNCVVYLFGQPGGIEGATLDEIETWLSTPTRATA